jgi:hypothetical protein
LVSVGASQAAFAVVIRGAIMRTRRSFLVDVRAATTNQFGPHVNALVERWLVA